MNALGRYGGKSFNETLAPAISPRVASTLPSRPVISMVGGRFGISSDWIAGRCAPTQTTTPTTAIAPQSPSTAPQKNRRGRLKPEGEPDFRLLGFSFTLRSRGGGGSSSSASARRLAAFFGLSSDAAMRAFGLSRRAASAAARPNRGSLRPPLFFRPHAIRNTPTLLRRHANAAGFKGRLRRG